MLLACGAFAAQRKSSHSSEQTHFSAEEDAVRDPVTIPKDVLAILRTDDAVRGALEDKNIPSEKMPLSWFSASKIHLSNPRRSDIIVVGEPPLAGANVVTFWVFRATPQGYKLVLNAPAHDLAVANTRSKGYRDIELTSMTAVQISTVLCRFDGKKYAGNKTRTDPIR
jgi:hypothetical protein